ncbi:MAG: hypothetical protein D6728_02665 [Cyanobacteria bacterium J055]|nr:MAG: hypothetical protein D6728_02665 [Cyanobacteria bacterium J055]
MEIDRTAADPRTGDDSIKVVAITPKAVLREPIELFSKKKTGYTFQISKYNWKRRSVIFPFCSLTFVFCLLI